LAGGRSEVSIDLPRTRFNFTSLRTTRAQLFARPVTVSAVSRIRVAPDKDAVVLGLLQPEKVVMGVNLRDEWYEIEHEGGTAFIWSDNVVPRKRVALNKIGANVRSAPKVRKNTLIRNTDIKGIYNVFGSTRSDGYSWLQIQQGEDKVWFATTQGEKRYFSAPPIHFVAGLVSYFTSHHRSAAKEFERFVNFPGVKQDNVNLSTAYQYLAVTKLLDGNPRSSWAYLRKASAETPFDPTPYKIQAFSYVDGANQPGFDKALQKVRELEWDTGHYEILEASLQKVQKQIFESRERR
jgi:hypothetical protein